jgi:hypothetical protein
MIRMFAGIGTLEVCGVLATTVAAGMQGVKPVAVPRGDGAPVITDGIFTAGEWDDALKIVVNDGVTAYLKEYRGVVFVGVRGQQANGIGPSELSLAGSDGVIRKLHRLNRGSGPPVQCCIGPASRRCRVGPGLAGRSRD